MGMSCYFISDTTRDIATKFSHFSRIFRYLISYYLIAVYG